MDGVDFVQKLRVDAGEVELEVASCGTGPELALCLHGFPECWYSWRHQMPLLADRGYRVWAPNLRGYGASDRPEGIDAYSIERLMGDVAGLIDASGAERVTLLGHDWGAVIAWFFAMRRVRPLERLVIMNVPHPACMPPRGARWRQLAKSWYALLFQLPRLPEWLLSRRPIGQMFARTACHPERFDAEVQRVYSEYAARPGALRPMVDYYRALIRGGGGRRQLAQGYPEIETPTLMLWGERDVALRVECTRDTHLHVRDLCLRLLPDASHWVQQDDPDTVNAMLSAWLRGSEVPEAKPTPPPAVL